MLIRGSIYIICWRFLHYVLLCWFMQFASRAFLLKLWLAHRTACGDMSVRSLVSFITFALLLIVIWKAAHCTLFPNRHRSIIVVLVHFSYCFLVREMTHSKFVSVCTFSYWFQSHCNVLSRFSAQNCYTHEFAIFSNTLIACEDNIWTYIH